jgi:hypothetical protein
MSEKPLTILRWTARLSGLFVAGCYALLVAGEILHPHSGPPTHFNEWLGIFLFSLASAAMLGAWRWELPGAVVSLSAIAAFAAVIPMRVQGVLIVAAVPGALFLADWLLRKLQHTCN